MDPSIANIITALVSACGGGVATHFLASLKEARQGRKDEAQRLAEKADHAKARARTWQGFAFMWREHAFIVRAKAVAANIELPPIPPMNPIEEE